jgi:hypothetical protein
MDMGYIYYGLILSMAINLYLLFVVRTQKARESLVLKTSEEMIQLSEAFSHELQQLRDDTEEA